jgi:hypothetical protein
MAQSPLVRFSISAQLMPGTAGAICMLASSRGAEAGRGSAAETSDMPLVTPAQCESQNGINGTGKTGRNSRSFRSLLRTGLGPSCSGQPAISPPSLCPIRESGGRPPSGDIINDSDDRLMRGGLEPGEG